MLLRPFLRRDESSLLQIRAAICTRNAVPCRVRGALVRGVVGQQVRGGWGLWGRGCAAPLSGLWSGFDYSALPRWTDGATQGSF